ncbi:MAG TPA: hypothetical protein VI456_03415 [Polyangia bacterium]
MFRLIKLGITLVGLAAFAWFGVTVKLGSMTLFQHLRAIGQTKESQELVDGTRKAAGPLVDDVRRKFQDGTKDGAKDSSKEASKEAKADTANPAEGPPEERVSAADRQALHRLIRRVDR